MGLGMEATDPTSPNPTTLAPMRGNDERGLPAEEGKSTKARLGSHLSLTRLDAALHHQ